ncbi:hypothetical protein T11_9411 [Trichinella zimbabwensis]|uniref:Uncharacterized protein n=1 Tax=Trichinella zimbabwensis TaxID=268475 RepID=A0A0V1I8W1_9BILA|nr:hypothetical protein T11_9411 [Trichinella zimbabwensis]
MRILALKRKFISRQHIAGFIKIDGALKSMSEIFSLRPHPVDTDTVLSNSQTLVLAPRVGVYFISRGSNRSRTLGRICTNG